MSTACQDVSWSDDLLRVGLHFVSSKSKAPEAERGLARSFISDPCVEEALLRPLLDEVGATRSPSKGPQGAIETGGDALLCILLRSQGPIKVPARWGKATAHSDVLPFKCTRNEFLTMSSHLKLPGLAENYGFHRSCKELKFTLFSLYHVSHLPIFRFLYKGDI